MQRGIRFDDYLCLRTYHDGYKMLEPIMLFNLQDDPHEQHNLAESQPALVNQAMAYLLTWIISAPPAALITPIIYWPCILMKYRTCQ